MAYQQLPPSVPVTVEQAKQASNVARQGGVGCGIVWLAGTALFTMVKAFGGIGFGTGIILLVLWAIGLTILGVALLPQIRAWKITPPEIDVSREAVRLGESFDFRYYQAFKDRLDLDFARVEFFMRETAIYRRGTDTYTETHEVPVYTKEIPRGSYRAGDHLDLSHRFTVPPDGMHTFLGSNNRIEWLLRVKVSIARWPDVNETYPVRVLPERFEQGYEAPYTGRVKDV
ncbi:MAG: hypothetical protein H7Y38_09270 [Armatimonadetes bacterium]|nr:hypothetical protein [Armatimonadota bacterium]